MLRPSLLLAGLCAASAPAFAQQQDLSGRCALPDSIAVRGNSRVSTASIRGDAGLTPGQPVGFVAIKRAVRDLFATGQFDDVQTLCVVSPGDARATLVIQVRERPLLGQVSVVGVDALSARTVQERVGLAAGRPADPALVSRAVARIDSLYESRGYYLARIRPESTVVGERLNIVFRVDEGRRLAVSGVRVRGNSSVPTGDIVGAMKTKPEGFWWFRKGEFDDDKYASDVADNIPTLYARRGYVDMQVSHDTLVVDRERGKALIDLAVTEGPRYKVGTFEVVGNRRFSTEELERYYPFTRQTPTLTQRVGSLIGRRRPPSNVFDRTRWEDATQRVRTAYSNEGYIYANVRPVVERTATGRDSTPTVNLRWEVDEKSPAIVNRVEIAGNDFTSEACIREQLVILPGDVFNQDRLIRSYQNIANLGFFNTPLPPPDTKPANEQGDVDIVFKVTEKRTGTVNLGASAGAGTGVGGMFSLDQPNLFGQCKRGQLQWQFGRYINDFSLSYTDPALRRTRTSATVTAYHRQLRYRIADVGQSTSSGGSIQFGFPVPNSPFSRLFVSYGGETVKFRRDPNTLLGSFVSDCRGCFRSTLGLTGTHDTRFDLPFPSGGGIQTLSAQFNGGPLGGEAKFQRYTQEVRGYTTLGQIGGTGIGSQPIKLVFGQTLRSGFVFGNTGVFFNTQQFALGGTQYGEQLRGYCEFSITPVGYDDSACSGSAQARRTSFGSAFFTSTSELGLRFNQVIYVNAFYDAGNVWQRAREFDPTRLFRGAGLGVSLVTPLGPLGFDYAYGFDRVDLLGRPAPKWQFHFKLGQQF